MESTLAFSLPSRVLAHHQKRSGFFYTDAGDVIDDKKLLKSYVFHGDQCFYVSTIERDSSALVEPPPPRYAETLVWEYDMETKQRGTLIGCDGDGSPEFQHCRIVEHLFQTGFMPEEDDG